MAGFFSEVWNNIKQSVGDKTEKMKNEAPMGLSSEDVKKRQETRLNEKRNGESLSTKNNQAPSYITNQQVKQTYSNVAEQRNKGYQFTDDDIQKINQNFNGLFDINGNKLNNDQVQQYNDDIQKLNANRTTINDNIQKLTDNYQKGLIDQSQYTQLANQYEAEWNATESERERLESYRYKEGYDYYDAIKGSDEEESQRFYNYITSFDNGVVENIALSEVASIIEGLNTVPSVVSTLDDMVFKNSNSPADAIYNSLKDKSNELRSYIYNGKTDGGIGYYSVSIVNSLLPMMNAMAFGSVVGQMSGMEYGSKALTDFTSGFTNVALGLQNGGEVAKQRLAEGNSYLSSILNGAVHGYISYKIESMDAGRVASVFTGGAGKHILGAGLFSNVGLREAVLFNLNNGLQEGTEELLEAGADWVADNLQNAVDTFFFGGQNQIDVEKLDMGDLTTEFFMAAAGACLLGVPQTGQVVINSRRLYNASIQVANAIEQQKKIDIANGDTKSVNDWNTMLNYIANEQQTYLNNSKTVGKVEFESDVVEPFSITDFDNMLANAMRPDVSDALINEIKKANIKQSLVNLTNQSLESRGMLSFDELGNKKGVYGSDYMNMNQEQRNKTKNILNLGRALDIDVNINPNLQTEQGSAANGSFNKATGMFDVNPNVELTDSTNTMESTLVHEITHRLENTKMYDAIKKDVINSFESKEEFEKEKTRIEALYSGSTSNYDPMNELVAKRVEKLLGNQDFLNKLEENADASYLEKLVNGAKVILEDNPNSKLARDFLKGVDQAKLNDIKKNTKVPEMAWATIGDNGELISQYSTDYAIKGWDELKESLSVGDNLYQRDANEVEKWKNDLENLSDIFVKNENKLAFTWSDYAVVFKANGDYKWSVDASTNCPKRDALTQVVDEILERYDGVEIDFNEMQTILEEMQKTAKGIDIPCAVCFVESQRTRQLEVVRDFATRLEVTEDGRFGVQILNSKGKPVVNKGGTDSKGYVYFATEDVPLNENGLPNVDFILKQFMHSERYNQMAEPTNPLHDMYMAYEVFNNARGNMKARMIERNAVYNPDFVDPKTGKKIKNGDVIRTIKDPEWYNIRGGFRMNSFSDFQFYNALDFSQVIADASIKGLMMQAYSKQEDWFRIFKNTGIKGNISVIVDGTGLDENGNLKLSSTEGVPQDKMMEFRKLSSKHFGSVLVGNSDQVIRKAMESGYVDGVYNPNGYESNNVGQAIIDYVIPFHKSQWSLHQMIMKGIGDHFDYTLTQSQKKFKGKKDNGKLFHFYATEYWDGNHDGNWNAQKYIQLCMNAKNTYVFPQFAFTNFRQLLNDFLNEKVAIYEREEAKLNTQLENKKITKNEYKSAISELKKKAIPRESADNILNKGTGTPNEDSASLIALKRNAYGFTNHGSMNGYAEFIKYMVNKNTIGHFTTTQNGKTLRVAKLSNLQNGYWKSLTDFKMYDNDGEYAPQTKVVPDVDVDYIENKFLNMKTSNEVFEGYKNFRDKVATDWKKGYDKRQIDLANKNAEEIEKYYEDMYSKGEGVDIPNYDIEYSIDDYMDAYNNYDDENASKIVEQEARKWGYEYRGYHHTNNTFTQFDLDKARKTMDIQGFYFSADPNAEAEYGDNNMDSFLKMRNPYIIDSKEKASAIPFDRSKEGAGVIAREWLQANGYDSVIRDHNYYGLEADEYIVFDSSQIKSAEPFTYDNDGELIPIESRFNDYNKDVRYSIDEQNYSNAISNNDIEKAQKILDNVATKKGYTKLYHGTNANFNVFDVSMTNNGKAFGNGIYLTDDVDNAKDYSELSSLRGGNPNVMSVYAKLGDSLVIDLNNLNDLREDLGLRKNSRISYDHIKQYINKNVWNDRYMLNETRENPNYDSVVIKNVIGQNDKPYTEYVIFDNNNVKSANAITYDDNGNIIPLSERFNVANDDIRYSIDDNILYKDSEYERKYINDYTKKVNDSNLSQEDKNELLSNFIPSGANKLVVSDIRLDELIKDSGASNKDYARNYIAWISPGDYLKLTTGKNQRYLGNLESQSSDLNMVELRSYPYPITLTVDDVGNVENVNYEENNWTNLNATVVGHEGRHRMIALRNVGITKVPVVIESLSNKYEKIPSDYMSLTPQSFTDDDYFGISDSVSVSKVTPINESYRNIIAEEFGTKGTNYQIEKYIGKESVQYAIDDSKLTKGVDLSILTSTREMVDKINAEQDLELTDEDLLDVVKGRNVSQKTLDRIEKTKDTLISNAKEWIPGYETIKAEYPTVSENVLSNALFETLVYDDIGKQTRKDLFNSFADGQIVSSDNYLKYAKDINDFVDEVKETFINETKYKMGDYNREALKRARTQSQAFGGGSVEYFYDKALKGVELNEFSREYKQSLKQKHLNLIQALVGLNMENVETKNRQIDSRLSYAMTFGQVLDVMGNGNVEVRDRLINELQYGLLDNAKAYKVKELQNAQEVVNKILDLGIKEGTIEDKAVQYFMEGHTEEIDKPALEYMKQHTVPGTPYVKSTEKMLKEQFNYKMPNGKYAWENIKEASEILRKAYDDAYAKIIKSQLVVNGDVKGNVAEDLARQIVDIDKAWEEIQLIKNEITRNGSKPSTQAAYESAKANFNKLISKYNNDISKNSKEDLTRRHLLPYREDYTHHVVKRTISNTIDSIKNAYTTTPTELAGTSDFTKPNTAWKSFMAAQEGGRYDATALGSFTSYMTDASDVIAYNPVIVELRAFNQTLKDNVQDNTLSRFSKYLNDYTNGLVGKRNNVDRIVEDYVGIKPLRIAQALNSYAKSAALAFNVRSALVQFANIPNGMMILQDAGGKEYVGDVASGIKSFISGESTIKQSAFLNERFFDFNTGNITKEAKMQDVANWMMQFGDKAAAKAIWYSAYSQGVRLGVEDAIKYADDMTRRSVAGRSKADMSLTYQSQMVNLLLPFQVENNNLWQTIKSQIGKKNIKPMLSYTMSAFVINSIIKAITGGDDEVLPEFLTPIYQEIVKALRKEQGIDETIENMFWGEIGEFIAMIPYGSTLVSLTFNDKAEELFGDYNPSRYGITNIGLSGIGKLASNVKNAKTPANQLASAIEQFVAGYVKGGKQLTRTVGGLQSMGGLPKLNPEGQVEVSPTNYTKSGRVSYVNDQSNPYDWMRAALFGKSATSGANRYYNGNNNYLSEKQQRVYETLNESNANKFENYLSAKGSDPIEEETASATSFISKIFGGETKKEKQPTVKEKLKESGEYDNYKTTVENKYQEYLNGFDYSKGKEPKTKAQFYNMYGITSDDLKEDTYDNFYKAYGINEDAKKVISKSMEIKKVQNALGKDITNSAQALRRKAYEDAGIYEEILDFVENNGLELSDFGLNKTIVEYDQEKMDKMMAKINGQTYTDVSGSKASGTSTGVSVSKSEKQQRQQIIKMLQTSNDDVADLIQKIMSSNYNLNNVESDIKRIKQKYNIK